MNSPKVGDWVWQRGSTRPGVVEDVDDKLLHVLSVLGEGVATCCFLMGAPIENFRILPPDEASYWQRKIQGIIESAGVTLSQERASLFAREVA